MARISEYPKLAVEKTFCIRVNCIEFGLILSPSISHLALFLALFLLLCWQ